MTSSQNLNMLKQYVNETKNLLPILRAEEKEYFHKLEESMTEVLENDNSITLASMDDCYRIFGYPSDIIHQYYSDIDLAPYTSAVKSVKLKNRILLSIGVAVLAILISLLVIMWQDHQVFMRSEVIFKTTEITEEIQ